VRVTSPSGRPVQGFPVNLTARAVLYSGGHDHDGNRPVGIFEQNHGQTNENGEFRTYYYATQFGGIERIIASGGNISDSADLTVRVPGLILLYDYPDYIKVGGTQNHHGPPDWQEDHNHFCMPEVANAIFEIAEEYVDSGGERIYINDLSLPYGGLFDIEGNWDTPHNSHRKGENADIAGNCVIHPPNRPEERGRFCRENQMINIIDVVARNLNLQINWSYEYDRQGNPRHHYHFTIRGGR